jgi:hypothetical protein
MHAIPTATPLLLDDYPATRRANHKTARRINTAAESWWSSGKRDANASPGVQSTLGFLAGGEVIQVNSRNRCQRPACCFVRPSGTCPPATGLAVHDHALTVGVTTPSSQAT